MTFRALAAAAALAGLAPAAHAQSAGDINRLNSAVQICNSPAGAAMAECAKLRGQLSSSGLGALNRPYGGGQAAGAVGILGAVLGAARASAPVPAPSVNSAGIRDGVAACVQRAAGDTAAIQTCLARASAPAPAVGAGLPYAPTLGRAPAGGDTATAIHQAGQSYQACAAANPTNWQSCLPLLNGAAR